jgi:transcriptional regulator with XRE-family HTH domain
MDKKALGRKIRIRRGDLKLTQNDIANALGRSHTAVSFWEAGTNAVAIEDVDKLADILQVQVRFFYEEDYWPSKTEPDPASMIYLGSEAHLKLSKDDVAWCRRMAEKLNSLKPEVRDRFRRKLEDDAAVIQDFLK